MPNPASCTLRIPTARAGMQAWRRAGIARFMLRLEGKRRATMTVAWFQRLDSVDKPPAKEIIPGATCTGRARSPGRACVRPETGGPTVPRHQLLQLPCNLALLLPPVVCRDNVLVMIAWV